MIYLLVERRLPFRGECEFGLPRSYLDRAY
jgi:hypothetical protein